MLRELLFDNSNHILLHKMLDKAALAQRVIAANIANVSTPGYRRLSVSFDEKLKEALNDGIDKIKRTRIKHLPDPDIIKKLKPEIVMVQDGYWNGINNVNIDQEMVELGENQLDFNIAAKLLNDRFNSLRTAIRGKR